MKVLKIIKKLLIDLYTSLRRFPAGIGFASATAVMSIILFHFKKDISINTRDVLTRINMILAFGVPIFLSIKLIFERIKNLQIKAKLILYGSAILFLVLYYFYLIKDFEMVPIARYIALSIAFYLAFIFIPYLYKRSGFELYVIKLLTRFFVTALYSLILFGGISAILFTINKLLGIDIDSRTYMDIWIAIVGIFATCFFLAGVPTLSKELDAADYPGLLKVLLLYIIIPLIIVYTIILYIYFAKVIITFVWPVGMVANLVLWYSVICAMVFFFITPISKDIKWVKSFIFWFSKIIIPLIFMMFFSIGIRTNAYGITENRYFVIILGLWVLGIMLYQTLIKNKRNIILPITLSIITVLSVFGPWSCYSVSKLSQNNRFEKLLIKNSMLKGNKIIKAEKTIPQKDKEEISQVLGYFSRSHYLKDVKHLPPNFTINKMEEVFGFPNTDTSISDQGTKYYFYNVANNEPINIKGYNYLFNLKTNNTSEVQSNNEPKIKYDTQSSEMSIFIEGKEVYSSLLNKYVLQIYKKYGTTNKTEINSKDVTFVDENEKVKIKIILQDIGGREDKASGKLLTDTLDFYLLLYVK